MHRPPHDDRCSCDVETHGDQVNVALARHLEARRLRLIGCLDEAKRLLAALDPTPPPPTCTNWPLRGSRCDGCGRRRRALPLAEPAEALVTLAMMSPTLRIGPPRKLRQHVLSAYLVCLLYQLPFRGRYSAPSVKAPFQMD